MWKGTPIIEGVCTSTFGSFASFAVPDLQQCVVSAAGTTFRSSSSFKVANEPKSLLCPPLYVPSGGFISFSGTSGTTVPDSSFEEHNMYVATSSGWHVNLDSYFVLSHMVACPIVVEGIHFAAAVVDDAGTEVFVALGKSEFDCMCESSGHEDARLFRAPGPHYKGAKLLDEKAYAGVSVGSNRAAYRGVSADRLRFQGGSLFGTLSSPSPSTQLTLAGSGFAAANQDCFRAYVRAASSSPKSSTEISLSAFCSAYFNFRHHMPLPATDKGLRNLTSQWDKVSRAALARALTKPVSAAVMVRLVALSMLRCAITSRPGGWSSKYRTPSLSQTNPVGVAEVFAFNAILLSESLNAAAGPLTLRDVFSHAARLPVSLGALSDAAATSSIALYSQWFGVLSGNVSDTGTVSSGKHDLVLKLVWDAFNPADDLLDDLSFLEEALERNDSSANTRHNSGLTMDVVNACIDAFDDAPGKILKSVFIHHAEEFGSKAQAVSSKWRLRNGVLPSDLASTIVAAKAEGKPLDAPGARFCAAEADAASKAAADLAQASTKLATKASQSANVTKITATSLAALEEATADNAPNSTLTADSFLATALSSATSTLRACFDGAAAFKLDTLSTATSARARAIAAAAAAREAAAAAAGVAARLRALLEEKDAAEQGGARDGEDELGVDDADEVKGE